MVSIQSISKQLILVSMVALLLLSVHCSDSTEREQNPKEIFHQDISLSRGLTK